ncbi:MAG: 3-deoxy-D-manno-octulosonate 8-phosphate phosphatase [Sphingobacteriia bacterium]|nr:MAG: 3-deoxy-D-manno-octulosonate 8-phosphate phosphatase [Sphingobacteriia bacterium]
MLQQLKNINTFVFDVDGVLTDGSLLVMPNGILVRRMNIKDGYALQLAIKKGYQVWVISGGNSPEIIERLLKLGVVEVHMQVADKAAVFQRLVMKYNVDPNSCLYMGDDIPDLLVMKMVGFPACPSDAVQAIREVSKYISNIRGGEGCVRELVEKVMVLKGDWNEDITVRAQ